MQRDVVRQAEGTRPGWWLRLAGTILIVPSLLVGGATVGFVVEVGDVYVPVTTLPFTLLGALAGSWLVYRGRQMALRPFSAASLSRTQAFVLYLRPFYKDTTRLRFSLGNSVRSVTALLRHSSLFTVEEQLAEVVQPLGPLVAVGYPDKRRPLPGAQRTYLDPDTWQDEIRGLMVRADLVIVRPGRSVGVTWEMSDLRTLLSPDRVVVLQEGMRGRGRRAVNNAIADAFSKPFPEGEGVITFSPGWEPTLKEVPRGWSSTTSLLRPSNRHLRKALEPKLHERGANWHGYSREDRFREIMAWLAAVVSIAVVSWIGFVVLMWAVKKYAAYMAGRV